MDAGSSDARDEERRALLREQPWGPMLAKLTAIAHKRMLGRFARDAEDVAQSAIEDAYRSIDAGGWDPARAPLMSYLVAHVLSAALKERRRKRNACEVWLDEEEEQDEEGLPKHEKHLASPAPSPEDRLSSLRLSSTFHDLLIARFTDDAHALVAIAQMKEGVTTPRELAAATGHTFEEMKSALRRIRYHAGAITEELSASAADAGSPDRNEVLQ